MSQSIELVNYSRTFDGVSGPVHAVAPTSLSIEPGSLVAMVGPSGCGKSTILRAVAGLDTGYGGRVLVAGAPVTGPSTSRGVVFQEHRLFPWLTVADNVALGLDGSPGRRERVAGLLDLVSLNGFERAYPRELSGGMAQRAAIARALAPRPEVLLLDEPFGALDAFTRMHLQDAFQEIWRREQVTALLVTHDIEEAVTLAQSVVVLSPRPGTVTERLEIDLAHPRDRGDPRLEGYRRHLLSHFGLGGRDQNPSPLIMEEHR